MWPASGACFVARDPHTGAYDALLREATRLGGPNARSIIVKLGTALPATEDVRCLACHTNPSIAGPTDEGHVRSLRREGVSCEACHGNAGGWLYPHTSRDYTGMTSLGEIGNRAATCLGCHVGAPADPTRGYPVRDMNHDMIAAGHPRLNFDFAEYMRRLPKHWREKRAVAPVHEWYIGRVAHAEAACRLLADRAERAERGDERTPWPEFAEFDCAGCHHQIPQPWRNERARVPGSLRWQTIWPMTSPFPNPTEFGALKPLVEVTNTSRPARPAKLAGVASDAAAELSEFREWLAKQPPTTAWRRATKHFPPGLGNLSDWDTVGQVLWGVAAFERAGLIPRDPPPAFARAFAAVRHRNWDDLRPAFDRLLSELPRPTP
jgi:hypothetical protein